MSGHLREKWISHVTIWVSAYIYNLGQNIFEQVKKWELYANICELLEFAPPPINNFVAEPSRLVVVNMFNIVS